MVHWGWLAGSVVAFIALVFLSFITVKLTYEEAYRIGWLAGWAECESTFKRLASESSEGVRQEEIRKVSSFPRVNRGD
jgi:hypothetical protein